MKRSPDLTEKILSYIPENTCIVDIGCGDGEFLRSLTGKGYSLVGIDPEIRENEGSLNSELTFFPGFAEALPLPDNFADIILMQCVFSLCEPEKTLKEIRRVLKSDGHLIITDLMSGTVSMEKEGTGCPSDSDIRSGSNTQPGIGRILTRDDMEKLFENAFSLVTFSDEKAALLQMLIEAIFSDDSICITCEEQTTLKKMKAGYGFWVWALK